jgi:hypothetical protein
MKQITELGPRADRISRTIAGIALVATALASTTSASAQVAPTLVPTSQSATAVRDPSQPYAGMETRSIKALSPERVAELLAGQGAGYALAAELNRYPGPRHVLDLAAALHLRPEQEQIARELSAQMQQEAQRLGTQLVELEAELDLAFAGGAITPATVQRITGDIGAVDAQLRSVHLESHLVMRDALTPGQIAQYDRLRGYVDESPSDAHPPSTQGTPAAQPGHAGH